MRALLRIVVTSGACDHDRLRVDHLSHDAAGRVRRDDQDLVQVQLQRITAQQLNLNPILSVATNSTGGVMGKMIDAQSIMVACAACYDDPRERSHALGPIFRRVFWYSISGAAVIGMIALLQAYVFTGVIPVPPPPK